MTMTPEQHGLVEKAQDSLRGARLLKEDGLHAIAVSRAYYAMFYIAEAFLLEKDLSFSSHHAVISAFGQHFAKTKELPVELHRHLIDGFEERIRGDYEARAKVSAEKAAEMIEQAEAFIALAEQRLDASASS